MADKNLPKGTYGGWRGERKAPITASARRRAEQDRGDVPTGNVLRIRSVGSPYPNTEEDEYRVTRVVSSPVTQRVPEVLALNRVNQRNLLTGPTPGGPVVPDVIPSFVVHVAFDLWSDPNKDRGVITGYTREKSMNDVLKNWRLVEEVQSTVQASRLYHLTECMWQPDTNSFHLPFLEMTILLHDVANILCIPIEGRICGVGGNTVRTLLSLMCDLFGMTHDEIQGPFDRRKAAPIYKGNAVLVDSLYQFTSKDKSGDRIRCSIVSLLGEVDEISSYAWGAGALAYMYRQLGVASRADARGIAVGADTVAGEHLMHYRRMLDGLTPESVTWLPYGPNVHIEHPRTIYIGCIRFLDLVEPYQPNRCLHQFAYRQIIPSPILVPVLHRRPGNSLSYHLDFSSYADHAWKAFREHRLLLAHVFIPADPLSVVDPSYMDWFFSHSHPFVLNSSLQPNFTQRDRICDAPALAPTRSSALWFGRVQDQLRTAEFLRNDKSNGNNSDIYKWCDQYQLRAV
ncbi:hypothetical protein RND81_01G090100 [Saponaria officinalis]|uniref:Aminotransferase-like plant mobile domain-containing protein n=1 Tax=Saponaria officinalis TaxID=3572 RepID=A0AAW1N991_SAPOF